MATRGPAGSVRPDQKEEMQAVAFRGQAVAPVRLTASQPGRCFAPVVCAAGSRKEATQKRHDRIRRKLSGTSERPRLAVFRSNEHIYAQVIDDTNGHTLAAANTLVKDVKEAISQNGSNVAAAEAVGKKIAELCAAKNITKVAFDRGGFLYHGRIKALADAARAGGLQF